jgi:hypothetical protein
MLNLLTIFVSVIVLYMADALPFCSYSVMLNLLTIFVSVIDILLALIILLVLAPSFSNFFPHLVHTHLYQSF